MKSVQFKNHRYVGDPINAVKIFNEKEVDEIAIIDISATRERRPPRIKEIAEMAGEAFMPLSYGGGITTIDEIKEILFNGVEKVILNTSALQKPALLTEAARLFGAQSVVASIDVRKNWLGRYGVYAENGTKRTNYDPVAFAREMEASGAGEILLMNADLDGTYKGYDLELVRAVTAAVSIPVIAIGGAGEVADFQKAVAAGASAVAAGSMFVFQRPHQAVLISYPTQKELREQVFTQI